MIAWTLLVNPIAMSSKSVLWLIAPLCLGVAIIYKTIRTDSLPRIPRQVIGLMVYMACGLAALAVALWLLHTYWPF